MRRSFFKRGSHWLPTLLVLAAVLLAGGRLIVLTTAERAEQLYSSAETEVVNYASAIETELQQLAADAAAQAQELDQVLSGLPLSTVIAARYDFELAKIEANGTRRAFVSTRIDRLEDGVASRIRVPERFAPDLPSGQLELIVRPKSGWYPARHLAASIALLVVVAWLLAFVTHDLVHTLHRTREALSLSRRQLQAINRKLVAEIEQREDLQQSVEHSRYHDAFTGLPNRRYFMDQLDRALRDIRIRRRQRLAVLLIGIDRFKLINDTLGHTAGDELMVQAARRFQKATAQLDCVLARWSGDQFAALALDLPTVDTAFEVAHLLQQALLESFDLRKHRLTVGAHIGLAVVDSGLQRAEEVVREANIALSVAKQESASAVVYQPTMGGSAASLVSLEADLHVALDRRELHLLFQPIVDLRRQRVAGAEALLRWRHPVEGLLTPERFLGVADEVGLIIPITRWTIATACQTATAWRQRLPAQHDFYLSLNLSAAALRDPELTEYVARTLQDNALPPSKLKFELTENSLISNPGGTRETLEGLHRLGVEIMLDDFGTGYSSLSHLQLFPFDFVKIDRPFVNRTGSQRANTAIAAAVVQVAASLGLKSIAEIVETADAAEGLQRIGCDYAQGHFYAPPLEADELLQMLRHAERGLTATRTLTAVEREDDSPTLIADRALVLSDETFVLPVDEVSQHLGTAAEHQ